MSDRNNPASSLLNNDDEMDNIMLELTFPQIPKIVLEGIKTHIEYIKKFCYYEGRACLMKRAKNSGIPIPWSFALSSLNFGELMKEHAEKGPLIDTKFKPKEFSTERFKNELSSLESERNSYKSKLDESRALMKCMLTAKSYELITGLLDRTLNDIRSNVGKTNDNLIQNYLSSFNLDKILGYRWRSLLSDVCKQSKKVEISDSFKELIDSKLSTLESSKDFQPRTTSSSTTTTTSSSMTTSTTRMILKDSKNKRMKFDEDEKESLGKK